MDKDIYLKDTWFDRGYIAPWWKVILARLLGRRWRVDNGEFVTEWVTWRDVHYVISVKPSAPT